MCVKYYYMSLQERWLSKPVVSSGFTMDQRTTKKEKSVVFGLRLIRQVNTAPSNYKKTYPANTIIYSLQMKFLTLLVNVAHVVSQNGHQ